MSTFIGELSTWYLRRSRSRMRLTATEAERTVAFATLHAALVGLARIVRAAVVPGRSLYLKMKLFLNRALRTSSTVC